MDTRRFVSGAGNVVCVRAGIKVGLGIRAAFSTKFQDAIAETSQERAVVRNEKHRAVEVFERVDKHFLRCDVEVIRRLIQHQEIRRIQQHPGHHQPRLLAARQRANLLVHILAGKLKRPGQTAE